MFERLESRTLLSGNVIATVSRGTLVLRGDGEGNVLTVAPGPSPAEDGAAPVFVITGENGTTINGQSGGVNLGPVTRDVRVKLGGGDDRLTLSVRDVGRDVAVDLGRGADALTLDSVRVGRNLSVKGGAGPKTLALDETTVAGRAALATGADADTLTFSGANFGGRTAFRTGGGDDRITGEATFAAGRQINDGPGEDVVSLFERAGADVVRAFDFREGEQGWATGFADYPADPAALPTFELEAGLRPLPAELGVAGTGMMLSGHNRSDDLFMFLKRRLGPEDGVVPGQAYRVSYDITFASDAPTGCGGIGGAPGESVFLKAGAAPVEPVAVANAAEGEEMLRLNVDQGQQGQGGAAASVVGTIENGLACEDVHNDPPHVSLERAHTHDAVVTADAAGQLWLLVGTDSGFEGQTTLYYQNVTATLTPVAAGA